MIMPIFLLLNLFQKKISRTIEMGGTMKIFKKSSPYGNFPQLYISYINTDLLVTEYLCTVKGNYFVIFTKIIQKHPNATLI